MPNCRWMFAALLGVAIAFALPGCSEDDPAGPRVDATPPGTVSNLEIAVGSQTDSSLTLTWTAPGDDGDAGQATAYDLRWSFSDISDDTTWATSIPVDSVGVPQPAGENESLIVSGLQVGQTYYFALEALDEAQNRSARSNVASGSTVASPYSAVVNPDGTGDFLTIQAALDGTDDEAIIYISPGLYNEGLVIEARTVTLVGADPGACVVTHNLLDGETTRILSIDRCPLVRISGLRFVEQLTDCGNGASASYSELEFESCIFDSCGLTVADGNLALSNCTFYATCQTTCDMIPRAIVDLIGCNATIERCIVFAGGNGGIQCGEGAQVAVECTDCWHNPDPESNYIGCPDPGESLGNFSLNPLVVNAPGGDFHLQSNSPCLFGSVIGCGRTGALGTP